MMGLYYDAMGNEITLYEWAQFLAARETDGSNDSWWRRVTHITDDCYVSTVWLGMDHNFTGSGPPLIWETMIFGGELDQECWRYPDRPTALDDHERVVQMIRIEVALTT